MTELEYLQKKANSLENALMFLAGEFGKTIAQDKLDSGEIKNQDEFVYTRDKFESMVKEILLV